VANNHRYLSFFKIVGLEETNTLPRKDKTQIQFSIFIIKSKKNEFPALILMVLKYEC